MKKALIITTVSGFVPQFEMNNVYILQDLGYEVHYASNFKTPVYSNNNNRLKETGIICHQIDFIRSPYYIYKNMKALNQLIALMRKTKFHLVHCHTPMGGVLGRIAAHKTNTKPVIYTAHGFHFYKGAPVWNWLFFYPVEKFLAKWTDCLITINKEDYKRASKFRLKKYGKIKYVPGVGVNIEKHKKYNINSSYKRQELGIPRDAFLLISVGELSKRKNHSIIIDAIKYFENKNIYYIICGSGKLYNKIKTKIHKLNLEKQVHLLGYRTDIIDLLNCSDCFIFPSIQEGLPVAVLEAMNEGLPVIASDIRGNTDLLSLYKGGYLISGNRTKNYIDILNQVSSHKYDKTTLLKINQNHLKQFDYRYVSQNMYNIYHELSNI